MQSTYANRVLRPGPMRAAPTPPLPPRLSIKRETKGIEDTARFSQLSSTTQGITISTHSQDWPANVLGHPQSPQTVLTVTLSAPQTIAFAIGGAQLEKSSLVPSHNSGYIVLNPSSLANTELPIERPFEAPKDGKKDDKIQKPNLPRQRGDSKDFPIMLSPYKGQEPYKSEKLALPQPSTTLRSFGDDHSPISTAHKEREHSNFLEHSKSKGCTTSGPEIVESNTKLQPPVATQEEYPDRDLLSISQPQAENSNSCSDVLENEPEWNNSKTEHLEPAGKQMTRTITAGSQSHTSHRDPFPAEEPSQNGRTHGQVATHPPVSGANYDSRSTASGVAVHVPKRTHFHGEAQSRCGTNNKRRRAKNSDMSRERRIFLKDVYNLFAAPATIEKQIITSSDHLPEDAGQSLPSIEIPEMLEDTEFAIRRGGTSTPALSIHSASCAPADQQGSTIHGSMREGNGLGRVDRANLYQEMRITEPTRTPPRGDADSISSLPTLEDSPCEFPLDPLDAIFPDDLPKYKPGPPCEGTYSSAQR